MSDELGNVPAVVNPRVTRSTQPSRTSRRRSQRFEGLTAPALDNEPLQPVDSSSPPPAAVSRAQDSSEDFYPNLSESNGSDDADDSYTPSDTAPAPSLARKRVADPAPAAKPAAKRRKGNDATAVPAKGSLDGIGPLSSAEPASDGDTPQPAYGSLLHRARAKAKETSRWWPYVYPLHSDKQPVRYSLAGIPVGDSRPTSVWVGCRACNKPGDDGTPSV
jgi:hypothetical protein